MSVGQLPPPHLQWLSLHKGGSTPFCPQWTLFLCGLLSPFTPHWPVDSSILWNNPHPTPRSMDSVDSSMWGGGLMPWLEVDAWNTPPGLLLGTLLSTFTLPPVEPPVWRLDSSHSEVSSLPMPRTEHTPGCQFGLHISASPSLWYSSSVALTLPIPLQYQSHRTQGKRQTLGTALIAPWGVGGRN